ncbi:MAG TPA: cytochrome c oxidase subunit II [Polyangiaceae bacterium]|jgi:cytochrome c oxidase subunit 2|nr:cytochrome c oxidase subunit II [Polyangiaceae bacterium]
MQEFLRKMLFLPVEATGTARQIDRLHFVVIGVTFAGALLVGIVTLAFVVRFRARGPAEQTPWVTAPRALEFGVSGALLALFIAFWVVGFRQYVGVRTPPKNSLEIYVTAKQWMWKFSLPSGQRSAGVLVVPQGRPVRLILTSRDVVHSFFVPAFRVKQDAVPGRYTTLWFDPERIGTYPVYCAEYCGVDHSRMWGSVVVLSPGDYGRWLEGEVPEAVARAGGQPDLEGGVVGESGLTSMAEQGRTAASHYGCLSCHTIDGQRHIGPTWQGLYEKTVQLASSKTVVADEEYLTRSMMDPLVDVVRGYPPVMPVYRGVLSQPDAAAIVEFIKTLRFDRTAAAVPLPRIVATPASSATEPTVGAAP